MRTFQNFDTTCYKINLANYESTYKPIEVDKGCIIDNNDNCLSIDA